MADGMINIEGLDKAKVLRSLFNNSKQQGMGFADGRGAVPMAPSVAEDIVHKSGGTLNFDYLMGRVMKVDITGDSFHPFGYDRDNGEGAAARAVDRVR